MTFNVVYLKHSLFADCEKITATVTQAELVQLLQNGMISVLSVQWCAPQWG